MSFVSIEFLIFTLASLFLYYILPSKKRWIALLIASYAFYIIGGKYTVLFLVFTTFTTYFSARLLDRINNSSSKDDNLIKKNKRNKKLIVACTLLLNFGLLFFFKYWNFVAEAINKLCGTENIGIMDLILPLGISFYIFQSIGYLIDIYRKKYPAEKNLFKYATFISFFPQIVQGPISRFDNLGKQLSSDNKFSWDNIKEGIQIILWGLLKKLVIADRAAIVVTAVFNNYKEYDGAIILFSVILYCIQLYCDFSGGIDITRGVSKLFGITLIDNFKRPIFATSLQDFWRRWHISLGTWMKDYLFYPLSLSKPFIKLGKKIRTKLSGKAGKIIPVSIVTFIVYFAIGIWHGASFKYIVFGLWNGTLITLGLLLEPVFISLKTKLRINDKKGIFKFFQVLRTSILVLIGRYITRASRFMASIEMLTLTFTTFTFQNIIDGKLLSFALTLEDYIVILVGVLVLLVIEAFYEKGINLRLWLDKKPFILQWGVMIVALLVLLWFGINRGDYIASEFIYKQF